MPIQHATALLGQRNRTLLLIQRYSLNEALVLKVAYVEGALPRIAQGPFETTRNAPTVERVRASDPLSV
jgi:hypothetical protein